MNEVTPFGWSRERFVAVLKNVMSDLDNFDGPETFITALTYAEGSSDYDCAEWWSFEVDDAETVTLCLNETSPGGGFTYRVGTLTVDGCFTENDEWWENYY